jgi:Methylene-tetrahydrofolate reductase C terminal
MATTVAPPPAPTPVAAAPRADDRLMPTGMPTHLRPDQPRPTVPKVATRAMFGLQRLLEPNRFWYRVALRLESTPRLYRAFTWAEKVVKGRLFGCRMCAQCALPTTAYTCPMTCPKQLRNGPCGGVSPEGMCEVYPDLRCVWTVAYERAEREGRVADLRRLQRPIDQRKWGESAWINYWLGRDEGLWTKKAAPEVSRFELPILPATSRP